MLKLEIIGNLGADAERKNMNGGSFVSFRVAHSKKVTNPSTGEIKEETAWISCTLNGDGGKLFPYLVKGQKIFIRGNGDLRLFTSSKDGRSHAGLNCRVSEIELCGGNRSTDGEDKPY